MRTLLLIAYSLLCCGLFGQAVEGIYIKGERKGEVHDNGDIYIGGSRKGFIRSTGGVFINGDRLGLISDGEIFYQGYRVGRINMSDGFVYGGDIPKNDKQIGQIQNDGGIFKDGLKIGHCGSSHFDWTAGIVFFFFRDELLTKE